MRCNNVKGFSPKHQWRAKAPIKSLSPPGLKARAIQPRTIQINAIQNHGKTKKELSANLISDTNGFAK
jgi:hypothetical protein